MDWSTIGGDGRERAGQGLSLKWTSYLEGVYRVVWEKQYKNTHLGMVYTDKHGAIGHGLPYLKTHPNLLKLPKTDVNQQA